MLKFQSLYKIRRISSKQISVISEVNLSFNRFGSLNKNQNLIFIKNSDYQTCHFFKSSFKMSEIKDQSENLDSTQSSVGSRKEQATRRHANTQHGSKKTADEENIVVS